MLATTSTTFQPFSLSHGTVLLLIGLFSITTIFSLRRSPDSKLSRTLLGLLVFASFTSYATQSLAWSCIDTVPILDSVLPFHLCDIAALICGFALLYRKPLLCELSYLWGLAATTQGLITPVLHYDFPHPIFISFFQLHGSIVTTALILPLGLGWRPRRPLKKTLLRCFLWLNLYVIFAFIINKLLGTNFGFVTAKPDTASALDHFGPWPYYIVIVEILMILAFTILLIPFAKKRASALTSV